MCVCLNVCVCVCVCVCTTVCVPDQEQGKDTKTLVISLVKKKGMDWWKVCTMCDCLCVCVCVFVCACVCVCVCVCAVCVGGRRGDKHARYSARKL